MPTFPRESSTSLPRWPFNTTSHPSLFQTFHTYENNVITLCITGTFRFEATDLHCFVYSFFCHATICRPFPSWKGKVLVLSWWSWIKVGCFQIWLLLSSKIKKKVGAVIIFRINILVHPVLCSTMRFICLYLVIPVRKRNINKISIPAIVMRFFSLTSMMWFLAILWVFGEFGFRTSGRIPLQADRTSPRRTLTSGLK